MRSKLRSVAAAGAAVIYYGFARHLPPTNVPAGHLFTGVRVALVRAFISSLGTGIDISKGVYLGFGRDIEIGSNSGIGPNAEIHGPLSIGSNVMISPWVMIHTRNHNFSRLDLPIGEQGYSSKQAVVIEDDVWIGARAIILPGVRIGRGSVIGAGTVLARSVDPYSVVAGNPGRVVKNRLGEA